MMKSLCIIILSSNLLFNAIIDHRTVGIICYSLIIGVYLIGIGISLGDKNCSK